MKTLLVTGASGFLGWHICQVAQADWQVVGTYCHTPTTIEGCRLLPLDLTDYTALTHLFSEIQPNAVIHTAAQSKPNWCQLHPHESYAINVTASVNIAGLCADAGIPYAFTSTDMVFDGTQAPYREIDPVCPVNIYAEQKVAAEVGILQRYPAAAVCRMPLMFGATPTAPSFLQPFLQTLRDGGQLKLFTDEYRTPVSGTTAAQGLLLAIAKASGYLHLGGRQRLSRYEFGQLLLDVFDLPKDSIQPCRQADVPMAAPRPPDLTMDSSLAFSLGYQPLPVVEELWRLQAIA